MKIIGITGNSGTGKDTVSTIIEMSNENVLVIDADKIVKKNQKKGCNYYEKLVNLFGEEIIEDEKIDRYFLSKKIFSDKNIRDKVNAITFELVGEETKKLILENQDKEFIILNFPLLYEGNFDKLCDCVIAIIADLNIKIDRISERDMISLADARKRLETQMSDEFYKENANYIIDNSRKSYKDLCLEVKNILEEIKNG